MSVISPKGTNALCRSSRLVSGGSEDTWIVHFARAVAVAAIFPVRVSLLVSLSRIQEQSPSSESIEMVNSRGFKHPPSITSGIDEP